MDTISLLTGILSSIIAAILIATIAWSKGWISFKFKSFVKSKSMYHRIDSAGITNFYSSREDYIKYRNAPKLLDYLQTARKNIKIASYWMANGVEMENIANKLAEMTRNPNNISIIVAVIDPIASYIDNLATYLDMLPNELRNRSQTSLYRLWQAKETLLSEEKKRFIIKVYNTIPIASVIMLDSDEEAGKVQIDIRPYKAPRSSSFAFELSGNGKNLYELCKHSWTRLLNEAEEFDPKKHLVGFEIYNEIK